MTDSQEFIINNSKLVITIGDIVTSPAEVIVSSDDTPFVKSIRYDLSDIDWIDYVKEEHDKVMQKFRYCLQLYLQ